MNKMQKFLLLISLSMYGFPLLAQAPVVDAGENFAITSEPNDQQALAHDDTHQEGYFSAPSNGSTDNSNEIGKLLNQIHDLQQNIQELRGQLDNQNHTIETLKSQQLSLYKDLDDRIRQLNGSPANSTNKMPDLSVAPKTAVSSNPADEQISYMAAYKFIEKKDFSKAETALQTFVEKYPQSGYTPNAEYWLGELFMQQKNYAQAMAHFENVVNNFPSSNKHAACLYKLGVALAANGQIEDGKNRLQAVIQKYPDSDTAKLAENKLHTL